MHEVTQEPVGEQNPSPLIATAMEVAVQDEHMRLGISKPVLEFLESIKYPSKKLNPVYFFNRELAVLTKTALDHLLKLMKNPLFDAQQVAYRW